MMKFDCAIKLQNRMVCNLKGIYSTAEIVGQNSSYINNKVNDLIYSYLKEEKAPQWLVSFIKGYELCIIDNLYRNDLVFGIWYNGKFYSTHRDRDDYYEKHGISAVEFNVKMCNENKPGHYWKRTLKPYFNNSSDEQ